MICGFKRAWANRSQERIAASKKFGINKRDKRKVLKIDVKGNSIHEYNSRREAFLQNNKLRDIYKSLGKSLEGKVSICKGYSYRYKT